MASLSFRSMDLPERPEKSKEEKASDFLDSQFEEEIGELTTDVQLISTTPNKLEWVSHFLDFPFFA